MGKLAANATLVVAAVQALIEVLIQFGVSMSMGQQHAIIALLTALFVLIAVITHPSMAVGSTLKALVSNPPADTPAPKP